MTLDEEALFSQGDSQKDLTDRVISQRDSNGEFEHHITIPTMIVIQKQYCIPGEIANINATLKT